MSPPQRPSLPVKARAAFFLQGLCGAPTALLNLMTSALCLSSPPELSKEQAQICDLNNILKKLDRMFIGVYFYVDAGNAL